MKQLYSSGPLGSTVANASLKASSAGVPADSLSLALNHPGYALPYRYPRAG